jgi:hypothetical protein
MHTRFDTESKIAVTQAADIAHELGHRQVGPGHLLAGLLANPRGTAYAALRDHGLDLTAARDLVASHHLDEEADPDDDSREGADQGRRYDEDRQALRAIGIDLDRVREAVRDNLGADLADGWADRPERGPRRGRGRRHHHGHHHEGRGRRGPRSRREGRRGTVAFSPSLRALLRDVRREVLRDRLAVEDRDQARQVPGLTGPRMLVALTRSDDPAVEAVLATSTDVEGLRAQAEAAVHPGAAA